MNPGTSNNARNAHHASWQDFLDASGAHREQGVVVDFGDPNGERLAARDATVMAPLLHLGLLACSGQEAKTFLHNQVTSDINHLGADAAQHSAWCSAKGRMLASFLLFRQGEDYRIQLSADLVPSIEKRLNMFILRAKVKVADWSASDQIIGLSGAQAEASLLAAGLPVPARVLDTLGWAGIKVVRLEATRFEIVVATEAAAEWWTKLAASARPVGSPVWQWLDIQAGVPLISQATSEEFVPQMANFDQLGGVSFHKGCYPGQEVVARTQYLGKVKRHLYRIRCAAALAAGQAIYSPENPDHLCGMVANAAPTPEDGYTALAVIQENFVTAGDLELGAPGGPAIETERVTF
jgi:folate-binding protein YgfZ